MSGLEPRMKSPERLDLLRVDSARYEDGRVQVTVTFAYDTWCCNEFHEVVDGVEAIHQMLDKSQGRSYKKRVTKLQEDYKLLIEELDKNDNL